MVDTDSISLCHCGEGRGRGERGKMGRIWKFDKQAERFSAEQLASEKELAADIVPIPAKSDRIELD